MHPYCCIATVHGRNAPRGLVGLGARSRLSRSAPSTGTTERGVCALFGAFSLVPSYHAEELTAFISGPPPGRLASVLRAAECRLV